MALSFLIRVLVVIVTACSVGVRAQPSPEVQRRISAVIEAAASASTIDYTSFVNPLHRDRYNFGVCPGASVPFGMVALLSSGLAHRRKTGYVTDNTQFVRGVSPLHDSGTGYGNFEIMPLICPGGFDTCAPNLAGHMRLRKNNTDYYTLYYDTPSVPDVTHGDAWPAYPSLTLNNSIQMEAISTRRAGGNLTINSEAGRIMIGGFWGSSFGPGAFKYQAFACYDLLDNGAQKLDQFAVWTGDPNGVVARGLGETRLNLSVSLIGGVIESGALFSFTGTPTPTQVTIGVGISFLSEQQACANAESEIGIMFEETVAQRKALVAHTPPNVTELLYSSLYHASLTPNNATNEAQGDFTRTSSFYYDSLCCRTFYPLMALHSPEVFAQIVDSYIDAGDAIVGHFAINYHNEAEALGIDLEELYAAQISDAEVNPPEWNIQGRQANIYNQYGYVPYGALDTPSTGRTTREGSRTLEVCDFAIRQVALLLNKTGDVSEIPECFMQKRFPNGTFAVVDLVTCPGNTVGFYESSSWEYSWFVPHDAAHLITLMGGNRTFINRLDHFFNAGYYSPGNERSFQTPIGYHYANVPASSVDAVRDAVFSNFEITPAGLPSNDDRAAKATLLSWHLLGPYPVSNRYLNTSTTVTVAGFDACSLNETIPRDTAAYVQSVWINNVTQASRCHFDFL
ncbi:glycosyl hydrolase family 92-domain-containing protein [Lactifluus subvellereus]|nr:glycosyl hydrolase family 92-domain-containing protein [Lactifluus subvellereus]